MMIEPMPFEPADLTVIEVSADQLVAYLDLPAGFALTGIRYVQEDHVVYFDLTQFVLVVPTGVEPFYVNPDDVRKMP